MTIQDVLKERTIRGPIFVTCPGCEGRMVSGSYVCKKCTQVHERTVVKVVLMTDEPEFTPMRSGRGAGCHSCGEEIREVCHDRTSNGGWLLCELPDALDYLAAGKLEPEDLRDLVGRRVDGKELSN